MWLEQRDRREQWSAVRGAQEWGLGDFRLYGDLKRDDKPLEGSKEKITKYDSAPGRITLAAGIRID